MKDRVGLLGGTFNPIHLGHVELGLKVLDTFRLDKILYILSARPPHKQEMPLVPAPIRWEMLSKALEPFPALVPCDIEMNRPDYSWTCHTVNELKGIYPETLFYFISGSENFLNIKTWKNYKTLLESVSFILVLRKEGDRRKLANLLKEENLGPCIDINTDANALEKTPAVYVFTYDSDKLRISSTLIREKIKRSQGVDHLVEKEVKKIMQEYKLYENR